MTTALLYILLLLPPGAIVWIVWSYRSKASRKNALSRERAALLLRVPPQVPSEPQDPVGRSAGAAMPALVSEVPERAAAVFAAVRRERFLSAPETLAYYLLKTGLPRHEVFPRVSLAAVLAPPVSQPWTGADQARFARHILDFVVCDKSLRVLTAVRLAGAAPSEGGEWVDSYLAAAGIRLVRLDPKAPPKREELVVIVTGAAS